MTRLARVVAVGVPHHITQRGNARQFILNTDADRKIYLDLLRQSIELHSLALVGYCLMSNTFISSRSREKWMSWVVR
jgi:putative transposase